MNDEQHYGILIRHWFEGNTLVLVLEEFSDGIHYNLSDDVREITIEGVISEPSLREGLEKALGDNLWLTVKNSCVVIAADFMPEQELSSARIAVVTRPHELSDVYALYLVTQSALENFREGYGVESRNRANLQAKIVKFIISKRERLSAKRDFLKERDPLKAASFDGMLTMLEELERSLELKNN